MHDQATFHCPHCGLSHSWKKQFANRRVRCNCKAVFRVPQSPDAPDAPAPDKASNDAPGRACPGCGAAMAAGAVLCIGCGLDLRSGKRLSTDIAGDHREAPATSPGGKATGRGGSGVGVKTVGRWVSIPFACMLGVGLLHGFSPYIDRYMGEDHWDRQRAQRLLEEYDLSERIVRGGTFGFASGLVILAVVEYRRWRGKDHRRSETREV